MSGSSTILDHFDGSDAFERVLEAAEANASKEREMEFVDGLRNKYDDYGERMFMSDGQYSWLMKLAGAR